MKKAVCLIAAVLLGAGRVFAQADDGDPYTDGYEEDEFDDWDDFPPVDDDDEYPSYAGEEQEPRQSADKARNAVLLSISDMHGSSGLDGFFHTIGLDSVDITFVFPFTKYLYGGIEAGSEPGSPPAWDARLLLGLSAELSAHLRPYVHVKSGLVSDFSFDAAIGFGLDIIPRKYFMLNVGYTYLLRYDINSFLTFSTNGSGKTRADFSTSLDFQKVFKEPSARYHVLSIGVGLTW